MGQSMSTTALLPEPTASAKELVRQLSNEQKNAVLATLVEQLIEDMGQNAALPVSSVQGKHLGYIVPQAAATKLFKFLPPVLTPEQRRMTEEALANPHKTFDVGALLKTLNHQEG